MTTTISALFTLVALAIALLAWITWELHRLLRRLESRIPGALGTYDQQYLSVRDQIRVLDAAVGRNERRINSVSTLVDNLIAGA